MSSSRAAEAEELERREEKGQYSQSEQRDQKQQESLQQQEEDLEQPEEVDVKHRGEEDLEEWEGLEHREEEYMERREDVERREEEDVEHREEDVEHWDEEDREEEKREMSHSKVNKRQPEAKEQSSNEAGKLDSSQPQQQSPQLPPLRSYVMAKRSGKIRQQQQQQQLAPNRVMLEAAKLLPRLRHSQPGIGYYRRIRGQAAGRSVDLWSSQEPTRQPGPLVLGPSQELTSQFYSESDNKKKIGVKSIITAASVNGHYPFSRIVYPNLIGQRVEQPSSVVQAQQQQQRSHTLYSGEGTFVLRHKLRQSAGCLARIMDSSSTGEAALQRAFSRAK